MARTSGKALGQRIEPLDSDVRRPPVDGGVHQPLDLERVLVEDRLDLRLVLDAQEQGAALAWDEGPGGDHLALGEQLAQVSAMTVQRVLHALERIAVLEHDEGVEGHGTPRQGAASRWNLHRTHQAREPGFGLGDERRRAGEGPLGARGELDRALELLLDRLAHEAHAAAHPAEAERMLHEAGLLEGPLQLPPERGTFQAACGGAHHAYPGGLPVHAWAALLHARGLAETYQRVYGV